MIHNPDRSPKGIFHMFPDNDTPGERLFLKLRELQDAPYTLKEWFDWFQANTDFDQLILEHDSKGSYWIHVSCRKNKSKNRHQVIRNLVKPALSKVEGK